MYCSGFPPRIQKRGLSKGRTKVSTFGYLSFAVTLSLDHFIWISWEAIVFLQNVFSLPHAVTPHCSPSERPYRLTTLLSLMILNPLFVLNKVCSVPGMNSEITKSAPPSIWLTYHREGRLLLSWNGALSDKVTESIALAKREKKVFAPHENNPQNNIWSRNSTEAKGPALCLDL